MPSTFLDVFVDSLTEIGQLGTGQTPSPEQAAQGQRVANRMLQKWSIQRLMLYVISPLPVNLTPNVQDYTLGPSGTIVVPSRPLFIESAQAVIPGTLMTTTLSVLDKSEWDAIADSGARTSASGVPDKLWPEYTYPNLTLHVHPIQAAAVILKLGAWMLLQQFASIFDAVNLPPAYELAIQHNLAMELCPFYDMPVSPALGQLAADSLVEIQKLNAQGMRGVLDSSTALQSPTLTAPVPS